MDAAQRRRGSLARGPAGSQRFLDGDPNRLGTRLRRAPLSAPTAWRWITYCQWYADLLPAEDLTRFPGPGTPAHRVDRPLRESDHGTGQPAWRPGPWSPITAGSLQVAVEQARRGAGRAEHEPLRVDVQAGEPRRDRERLRRGVGARDVERQTDGVRLQFAPRADPRRQRHRAERGRREAHHDRREFAVLGVGQVDREGHIAGRRHAVAGDDGRAAGPGARRAGSAGRRVLGQHGQQLDFRREQRAGVEPEVVQVVPGPGRSRCRRCC